MARTGSNAGGARQPLSRVKPGSTKGKAIAKAVQALAPKPAKPAQPTKGAKVAGVARPAKAPAAKPAPARKGAGATLPARRTPRAIAKGALPGHAQELHRRLTTLYPDAHCELDFRNAFELLVATVLSAQTTDKRVNMTTPALFAAYPDARALAAAPIEHLEELVKSTGFFRTKAKNIQGLAQALVDRHGGEVPSELDALVQLPGVGRKTANVVLGNAFNINSGVVVDTHVGRLSVRLGLTRETDPVKVEQALMPLFPQESWTMLSHLLIFHGRRVCDARKPRCGECALADVCPSSLV